MHRSRALHPDVCYRTPCKLIDDQPRCCATRLRFANISIQFDEQLRKMRPSADQTASLRSGAVSLLPWCPPCLSIPSQAVWVDSDCCNNRTRLYKYYHNEMSKWARFGPSREHAD